jgi:cob(I)alamin adenosyltransferase
MSIYTKKGDKGETKVFDKKTGELIKIRKDACKIEVIGSIDELNSFLGIIKSHSDDTQPSSMSNHQSTVEEIQENLFTINSILAGSKLTFTKTKTTKLEKEIDKWEKILPVQKNFIYYGGSKEASLIFFARAIARRAERSLVTFAKTEKTPEAILMYFNRLSDYLFILGRVVNNEEGIKERFWKTSK